MREGGGKIGGLREEGYSVSNGGWGWDILGFRFGGFLVHCAPPEFSVRHSTPAAPSVAHCGADAGCVGVILQNCMP